MIHPGFSDAEYERRVSDLQAGLEARGLSGAILTAEANYNYFAGYHPSRRGRRSAGRSSCSSRPSVRR